MPDISMCCNTDCSKRNKCYRYRAKPAPYRQAYANFKPTDPEECYHFLSIEGWDNLEEIEDEL